MSIESEICEERYENLIIPKYTALITTQKEYIDLLIKSYESTVSIAFAHGWVCPQEDVDKGAELRQKLIDLEKEL